MNAKTVRVEITTPIKKMTFNDAISVSAPGTEGSFQVLYNHAPLMSQLEIGIIKLETEQGTMFFATSGGFCEVRENKVSLLLETCEKAQEIDAQRAAESAERARKRLKEQSEHVDTARAEASLARAMNRLRVSKKVN